MRIRMMWALSPVVMLFLGVQANAGPIPLFNTGVGASGNPLAGGSLDPHWSIIAGPGITSPNPAVVVNDQSGLGVYAQSPDSRWVWVNASGAAGTGSPYTLRLTFDLTGFVPSTATISGSWGVDNNGSILLNGLNPVGSGTFALGGNVPNNYNTFHSFNLTGGFVSGINTLDFLATDIANPGALGALNVNHLVGTASAVPEPASVFMMCSGVLGLFGCRWRRRAVGSKA